MRMQLEWKQHSSQLTANISSLLDSKLLLDVTLSAEGERLKCHRLVLASASDHFKELLSGDNEATLNTVVHFNGVAFVDLECLVEFIYSGKTEVNPSRLSTFMDLAKSLKIKGFEDDRDEGGNVLGTPNKRKKIFDDKENKSPLKQTNSEPLYMNTLDLEERQTNNNAAARRRKLVVRSLDESVRKVRGSASASSGGSSISTTASSSLIWPNVKAEEDEKDVFKKPFTPPPPPPSSVESTVNATTAAAALLDPNELAAKGATLLHHLAVWMLEEKRLKEEQLQVQQGQQSLPAALNKARSRNPSRRTGSEVDRPDSGFDSKDESSLVTLQAMHMRNVTDPIAESSGGGSSPEGGEISRQAPNRQPIFRKRRLI